jgi:Na+/H+ antiporter NhaD/arsenite permease-like protein
MSVGFSHGYLLVFDNLDVVKEIKNKNIDFNTFFEQNQNTIILIFLLCGLTEYLMYYFIKNRNIVIEKKNKQLKKESNSVEFSRNFTTGIILFFIIFSYFVYKNYF